MLLIETLSLFLRLITDEEIIEFLMVLNIKFTHFFELSHNLLHSGVIFEELIKLLLNVLISEFFGHRLINSVSFVDFPEKDFDWVSFLLGSERLPSKFCIKLIHAIALVQEIKLVALIEICYCPHIALFVGTQSILFAPLLLLALAPLPHIVQVVVLQDRTLLARVRGAGFLRILWGFLSFQQRALLSVHWTLQGRPRVLPSQPWTCLLLESGQIGECVTLSWLVVLVRTARSLVERRCTCLLPQSRILHVCQIGLILLQIWV